MTDFDLSVERLFSTPVAKVRFGGAERLNEAVHEAVLRWREENAERAQHVDAWDVTNGWEIGPDFFGEMADVAAVATLRSEIERAFRVYVDEHHLAVDFEPPRSSGGCEIDASWATVVYDHAFLADEHIHHGTHFVGVYYVKVPPEIDGRRNHAGYLVLRDPRPGMHVSRLGGQKTVELVRPEEGLLVLMPSYVSHAVRPFYDPGERFSVNCNLGLQGLKLA